MGMLEVFDCRGKKNKKGNYPGLYLDDVINCVEIKIWRVRAESSRRPPRHRRDTRRTG